MPSTTSHPELLLVVSGTCDDFHRRLWSAPPSSQIKGRGGATWIHRHHPPLGFDLSPRQIEFLRSSAASVSLYLSFFPANNFVVTAVLSTNVIVSQMSFMLEFVLQVSGTNLKLPLLLPCVSRAPAHWTAANGADGPFDCFPLQPRLQFRRQTLKISSLVACLGALMM